MKSAARAFSRADLLFCVVGLTVLFALAASLLANSKSESQRVICFNNLRQIGRAFHVWGNDHQDLMPWQVELDDGGTLWHVLGGNLWLHYSWISNELGSPKILVCPADNVPKKIASDWGTGPSGFLNPQYRNNSVSYTLFLHALADNLRSLLATDRNIRSDIASGCSFLANVNSGVRQLGGRNSENETWTNAIHGIIGHVLFADGTVSFTTQSELIDAVDPSTRDDAFLHFLTF